MNTIHSNPRLLDILTREGVLVRVTLRYWRGRKKLTPEDLGLEPDQVSDRLISLGHKRLLPKEVLAGFALIESRVHGLVEASTFPFLGGIGRFLPNARLGEVRRRLEEHEVEFRSAVASFLEDYASHQLQAVEEWRRFARSAGADPERLVSAVDAAFPPADQLRASFGFEVHLFQLALPEALRAETLAFGDQEAVVEARRRVAQEAAREVRRNTEEFVGGCVATLREQAAQLCEEMLGSISSGKTSAVHQKTLNRLVRFIDEFKSLNFAGDAELEAQLDEARRKLLSRTAEEYRDSAYAQRQLVSGLTALKDRARELAQTDAAAVVQRFGEMGRRKFHFAA